MNRGPAAIVAFVAVALLWPSLPARAASYPPCNDSNGYANTTLLVVFTVKPVAGTQWTFSEAPSVVAQRLLTDLNANESAITFKEANGVVPNLRFDVTFSETNAGTRQDTASVYTTEPLGFWVTQSGDAPYITWQDAIDHLASNMLVFLRNGWVGARPCTLPDGKVSRKAPGAK